LATLKARMERSVASELGGGLVCVAGGYALTDYTDSDKQNELMFIREYSCHSWLKMQFGSESYPGVGRNQRETYWTESIAVGSIDFIEETKLSLGFRAEGQKS
jgi:hypothetical protein